MTISPAFAPCRPVVAPLANRPEFIPRLAGVGAFVVAVFVESVVPVVALANALFRMFLAVAALSTTVFVTTVGSVFVAAVVPLENLPNFSAATCFVTTGLDVVVAAVLAVELVVFAAAVCCAAAVTAATCFVAAAVLAASFTATAAEIAFTMLW